MRTEIPIMRGPEDARAGVQSGVQSRTIPAAAMAAAKGINLSGKNAGDMLREAADIVQGARNTTHGDKERSFQAIASLWNAYLKQRPAGPEGVITAHDVAWMMVLMKMARSHHGTANRDHFVDAAGYAAIAGEIAMGAPAMRDNRVQHYADMAMRLDSIRPTDEIGV